MSTKTCVIVQDVIARGLDPFPAAHSLDLDLIEIDSSEVFAELARLEHLVRRSGRKPIAFLSLQAARYARRHCPTLARGIALPEDVLRHGAFSSIIARDLLLNPEGIYLPWARVAESRDLLEDLFGPAVFLRPDSAMKPFPGFACEVSALDREIAARDQTDQVAPGEMVFIAPARLLPLLEYRCWIVEEEVVAAASYSWSADAPAVPAPDAVQAAARRVTNVMSLMETSFTADFVEIDGEVKLVELNALSTSGWYPGVDLEALLAASDRLFLPPER